LTNIIDTRWDCFIVMTSETYENVELSDCGVRASGPEVNNNNNNNQSIVT